MDNIYLVSNATGRLLKLPTDIKHFNLDRKLKTLKEGALLYVFGHVVKLKPLDIWLFKYQESFKAPYIFKIAANMIEYAASENEKAAAYYMLTKVYSPLEWHYNIFYQADRTTFDMAIKLIKDSKISFEGVYLDNLAITEKRRREHGAVDARDFYHRPSAGDTIYINGIKLKDVLQNMQYFSPVQQNIIKFLMKRRALTNE